MNKLNFSNRKAIISKIVIIIISYASMLAFMHLSNLYDTFSNFIGVFSFGYNIISVLLFIIEIFMLSRFIKRSNYRARKYAIIFGSALSIASVYGSYLHCINKIFISATTTIIQILCLLGVAFFTIPLSEELFCFADILHDKYNKPSETILEKPSKKKIILLFLISWAIVFISYIPIFLSCWPGNFVFDAKYQLQNVVENTYRTHHPLIHTILMGEAYKLGVKYGNSSAGFQLYTLLQMAILSSSFAFTSAFLYSRKIQKIFWIGNLLWGALMPLNVIFSISATKDVIFAAFFLELVVCLLLIFNSQKLPSIPCIIATIIIGILTCLFRNNMLYAFIAFAICCLFILRTWKKRIFILILSILIVVGTKTTNQILINATNASPGAAYRESMSIPLQSLARVANYRTNVLSPELYDEITLYIPENVIADYAPTISDPIKNYVSEELLSSNTFNFFKLWLKVGIQFPDEYIEAFGMNTLAYWIPTNMGSPYIQGVASYHSLIGIEGAIELEKVDYFPLAGKLYTWMFGYSNSTKLPIVGFLYRGAFYFWLVLFMCLWAIYKRNRTTGLTALLTLIYFGTCLLGPTASIRYIYNIVVSVPLLIACIFSSFRTTPTEFNSSINAITN